MAEVRNKRYQASDGTWISQRTTIIGSAKLSGKTRYSYCPTCYNEIGEDKSALSPLTRLTARVEQKADDGRYFKSFDDLYFCERCHKEWERVELEDQYIAKANEGA